MSGKIPDFQVFTVPSGVLRRQNQHQSVLGNGLDTEAFVLDFSFNQRKIQSVVHQSLLESGTVGDSGPNLERRMLPAEFL